MFPLAVPGGRKAIAAASPLVHVRLSVCRDILGYAYTPPGWHYFVAFLRQYAKNPGLPPMESVLARYFERFKPGSLLEAMTGIPKAALPGGLARLPDWPPLPWLDVTFTPANARQHFGPFSPRAIHFHDARCRHLYEKIRQEGYQPDRYPDGYIRGFYLKDGKRYRFIVTSGQHRIAVLAALGIESFVARIHRKFPRVADIDRILEWPQVANGTYTPEQAEQVFRLYFRLDGSERAKRLGLL